MIVELHAIANGDRTYAVQFISQMQEGLHQFQAPDAILKVDNLVLDETGRQRMHIIINGKEQ